MMINQDVYILGIESSCDDTSAAILHNSEILSNIVASQEVHEKYGGVVPELASRSHQANIVPVVQLALHTANIQKNQLSAIAFTRGPGLLGSLMVGTSFAKSMALALNVPLIDVNHIQAHVLAHFIDGSNMEHNEKPKFPFLCLTVSGGHTQIMKINSFYDFEVIGSTIDDAAGEAFDKVAKMLGLPYPGGAVIDKLAKDGDSSRFAFSKAKVNDYDFSFSGLKTSVLYFLQKETAKNENFVADNLNDICASFQHTAVTSLLQKLEIAAKNENINHIALAGGVSANSYLREQLRLMAQKNSWTIFIPKMEYCTDNAAMIAMAGYYKFLNQDFATQEIAAIARY